MPENRLALPPRTYRWLDRVTKLLGVALVAAGLEVGGDTLAGLSLAAVGATLALATVFVASAEPTDDATGAIDR